MIKYNEKSFINYYCGNNIYKRECTNSCILLLFQLNNSE